MKLKKFSSKRQISNSPSSMGSGVSTQKSSKVASAPKNDTSGSTMSPQKGSKEIGRLDASDVRSLEEAKDEIRRLRRIASEAFAKNDDLEKRLSTVASSSNLTGTGTSRRNKKEARAAVMAPGSDRDYVKKSIPKSDQVRNLIYHSIKKNMLFRACSEEELQDLIDAFDTANFKGDDTVIKQGDDGDLFYFVEDGKLDVMVSTRDASGSEKEVTVASPTFLDLPLESSP